ncbi:MAG: LSU ribosomal protein L28p @ LSU ribosomal protein L28p, zinc-dependent, partial [uncultured Acidimicrobiales bacterium]
GREPLAPAHAPALEPQHPANPGRRERHAPPAVGVHIVHQGRQGPEVSPL